MSKKHPNSRWKKGNVRYTREQELRFAEQRRGQDGWHAGARVRRK
jgi:hypothetical protein